MCAGGVIAYEMSSQLRRNGEEVGLLLLLDAATPSATKRPGRITKNRLGRLSGAIKGPSKTTTFQVISNGIMVILKKTWNALGWEAQNLALRWSARARFLLLQTILHRGWKWPSMIPSLTFREIYESAEGNYNPKPLTGPNIVLVRATFGEMADTPYLEVYSDASLGWATLVSNLKIADVEGGHSSMLQEPFVESLADAIRPVLSLQSKQRPIVALAVTESA
jgi:thioesterase domain-containing protein